MHHVVSPFLQKSKKLVKCNELAAIFAASEAVNTEKLILNACSSAFNADIYLAIVINFSNLFTMPSLQQQLISKALYGDVRVIRYDLEPKPFSKFVCVP